MKGFNVTAPGKLLLLIITVIGCFVVIVTGTADVALIVPVITYVLGLVQGNGVGAAKGQESVPVFSPKKEVE